MRFNLGMHDGWGRLALGLALGAALLGLVVLPAAAAPAQALVTIVDGDAPIVVRAAQRFAGVQGLRLRDDDIVHTGQATRFVRIEFADGTVLDLGPDTRVLLPAQGPHAVHLTQGWVKLAAPRGGEVSLATPRLVLPSLQGVAVLKVDDARSLVYAETGDVAWQDRRFGRGVSGPALREGQAALMPDDAAGAVLPRPPADWLQALPRAFADALPLRARLWQARAVEPGAAERPAYEELAVWLNHPEPALRLPLLARFRTLALQDASFRAGLQADMRQHPEWDRVLHPEKYRPKPRPVAPPAPPPAPPVAAAALATTPAAAASVVTVAPAVVPAASAVPAAAAASAPSTLVTAGRRADTADRPVDPE